MLGFVNLTNANRIDDRAHRSGIKMVVDLIPTQRKEKLPKGFSYPLGAELISNALAGVPQFVACKIHFSWKDTFWASQYQERLKASGAITVLDVSLWQRWREWAIRVHAVPAEHNQRAREQLCSVLPLLRKALEHSSEEVESFRWHADYDLARSTLSVSN